MHKLPRQKQLSYFTKQFLRCCLGHIFSDNVYQASHVPLLVPLNRFQDHKKIRKQRQLVLPPPPRFECELIECFLFLFCQCLAAFFFFFFFYPGGKRELGNIHQGWKNWYQLNFKIFPCCCQLTEVSVILGIMFVSLVCTHHCHCMEICTSLLAFQCILVWMDVLKSKRKKYVDS